MRIAYVCCDPGIPVFGCKGCSVHVQEVLREFLRRGAEVDLFATRLGGRPPEDLRKVQVHSIHLKKCGDASAREAEILAANVTVMKALESNGPCDLIYERYSLCSYAAMEHARDWKVPGLLETNSPLIEEQAQYRTLVDRSRAVEATRRAMSAAGAVLVVSQSVADYVFQHRQTPEEVHVIPNGVDTNRFCVDTESDNHPSQRGFTVGFVGTLKPWHGVASLLDAFGTLSHEEPSSRLVIVGDGPERERLEQQAAELPAEAGGNIHFTGAVQPNEIPALLKSMDVAVAPYLPQENFYFSPLKLFEYMAAGLPTVASKIGQIPQLITNGETGLLYPPGDIPALTQALLQLCQQPEICAQMGSAARDMAVSQFTWKAVVTRILDIAAGLRRRETVIARPHFRHQQAGHTKRLTY